MIINESGNPIENYIELFNREKVPILYWHKLALAYYRNGQVDQFARILREALKDNEINIDGSN